MRASKILAVAGTFFWISLVFAGAIAWLLAQNPPREKPKASLIMMDLLRVQKGEAVVSKRNIFSPGTSFAPEAQGIIGETSPEIPAEQAESQGEEAQPPPSLNINLRYIGFIEYSKSVQKITALIIIDGQPMAVVEGEVVLEGIRIGKISPQELEVILPDSTTRKFSLEGE